MELKDYIAISGKPGLFKLISQGKNIVIAENLETGQRIPVHGSSHISSMEEIAVFTHTEDKPLKEVFFDIYQKEEGKTVPDPKKSGDDQIRSYFASVLPTYEESKVYVSDIKKILQWYNILLTSGKVEWTLDSPTSSTPE